MDIITSQGILISKRTSQEKQARRKIRKSQIRETIKRHKGISCILVAFLGLSLLNFFMIFHFMKILQTL